MINLREHLIALQKEGMSMQKFCVNAGMNNAQYQRVLKWMQGAYAINEHEADLLRTHLVNLAQALQYEILNDERG